MRPLLLSVVPRMDLSFRRWIRLIAPVALSIQALALPHGVALACTSCDSNYACHSGDEQGGYLCDVGTGQCTLFYKMVVDWSCNARWCRTLQVCDNRRMTPAGATQPDLPDCDEPLLAPQSPALDSGTTLD